MLHKALTVEDLTAEGQVTAVVARMNVIDKDGDVTLPGFFGDQATRMVWGHQRDVWIGKGQLSEADDAAVFAGQFFMDTQAGQEAYKAVRGMGELAEWSYGFRLHQGGFKAGTWEGQPVRLLQPQSDGSPGAVVDEVSPVLVGAGEGTGTVALKAWQPGDPLPDATTLAQSIFATLSNVDSIAKSVTALHDHLTEQGHTLSDTKAAVLAQWVDGLTKALAAVQPVLDVQEAEQPPADDGGMRAAHAHLEQLLVGLPNQ